MRTSKLFTLAVVAMMALSVVGPAAAAGELNVSVSQDGDDVTVTVTENSTVVDGANVTVDAVDENASYEDTGDYTTDDEGVVELSAPEENVSVTVKATAGNLSGSTSADLVAESIADENETEEDAENETEAENESEEPFDVDLNVTFDNGTADYSNVTVNDSAPFGLYVSSFVHTVMDENTSGPMGQVISSFVTTFNPGQGPPEHAGPPENKTQGPPEDAGPPENKTQGPPEDAGPPSDEESTDDEDDVDEEDDDSERGPPDHARSNR
jgi:hypothetical protein